VNDESDLTTTTPLGRRHENLSRLWCSLGDLGQRLTRQGFDRGSLLGATGHEVRGLACSCLASEQLVVVAGDKLGSWYGGTFDPETGDPGDAQWRELPGLGRTGILCVVDLLRIVSWRGESAVVIGTRGNGAWIAPLAAVATPGWRGDGLLALPGSDGRVVRQLLADPHSETLLAAVDTGVLTWSLHDEPALVQDERLEVQVTAFAIDQDDSDRSLDRLYVASNPSGLHRIGRQRDGTFRVLPSALASAGAIWRGRGSVVERMVPISDLLEQVPGSTRWRRKYHERGVVGTTLRHLLLVHDGPDADGPAFSQTRLATARSRILDLAVFSFPSWQGLAVSTLEGRVRIFRPSGMRRPEHDPFASYPVGAPESSSPLALFSGFEDVSCLSDRVYGFALPTRHAPEKAPLRVVLGLGDHTVRLLRYTLRWELRREAHDAARALVQSLPLDEILAHCQSRALDSAGNQADKAPLILLLSQLGLDCRTAAQWRSFRLIVWDTLAHWEDEAVPVNTLQALRDLQVKRSDQLIPLEETIRRIRKYILDRRSFSDKQTGFAQLMGSSDPSLADDRILYRSILCSRRHGLIFRRGFQPTEFGEVQAFALISPPTVAAHHPSRSAGEADPADLRFLVATYRRTLWLLDGTGQAMQLSGAEPAWGHVQAIHVRGTDLVVSFSLAGLRRAPRQELSAPFGQIEQHPHLSFEPLAGTGLAPARALCALPGAAAEDDRLLWGDGSGCIHLMTAQGSCLLADLRPALERWGRSDPLVSDLQSYTEPAGEGTYRRFVAAATGFGSLHVLEWSELPSPKLTILDTVRTGSVPATSILVADCSPRQIVVASLDGLVAGYWLIPTREGGRRLAIYWAFKAGDAVRTIQHLLPASDTSLRLPSEPLIVVGSYDEHLHILDLLGRHLEVAYLPGIKVDRFVTTRTRPEDGPFVEARVYACGFENLFCGIFLMSRRRLIENIEQELRCRGADDREESLSRWRTYSLREGHLRHRFARQSVRYPGTGARAVIAEIRRLLRAGDNSDLSTGLVTALLRRLFQNRMPGEPDGGEPPSGLREILAAPDLYLDTVRLLVELEEQWDTPGSIASRRVGLFWIRSFLRGIEDLAMLRRWLEIGRQASTAVPLAAPDKLLEHYLEHQHELIQLKALQYVERQLFGWRGVSGRLPLFVDGELVVADDFDWLISVLLRRVRTHVGPVTRHEPNSVLLQIGRLLALLVKARHLDPLYLLARLQDERVLDRMSEMLEDQCYAMACLPLEREEELEETALRLRRDADILQRGRQLETLLRNDGSIEEVVQGMQALAEEDAAAEPSRSIPPYLAALHGYYRTLIPLLCARSLEEIVELKGTWAAEPIDLDRFPSHRLFDRIPGLLAAADHYWQQKFNDLFLDPPLSALRHQDFYNLLTAWRNFEGAIHERREGFSQQEQLLIDRLAREWRSAIDDEQTKSLLQDLFEIVDKQLRDRPKVPLNAVEAMTRAREEEKLTFTAFSNLFTRLLLFSEPQRASFFYLGQGEDRKVGRQFFQVAEGTASLIDDGTALRGLPEDGLWSNPEGFEQLQPDEILRWLTDTEPGLTWRVVPIPNAAETSLSFGFYLFGWEPGAPGSERFDLHRLTWTPLLQALAFRQASFEQQTMKNRIFSMIAHNLGSPVFKMRSDLGVLVKGFLDNQPEQREQKYLELLRQARHLTGIIDGILSLSKRKMTLDITTVSLARLLYDVVRTVRKDGQGKGLSIDVPRPPAAPAEDRSRCRTDEVKVYDILLNLLTNAIKYGPPNSRVQVELHLARKGFEIRVRDEGPGIPRDELPMLFQPFFRGRLAETVPGLGLGLYISRLYAQKLGGRLQVANNAERGVTFSLFLHDHEDDAVQDKES